MAELTAIRTSTILPATSRSKGEVISAAVPGIADHDTLVIDIARDPSWSEGKDADKQLAAEVVCEWSDGAAWHFLCGFGVAGDPVKPADWPRDVPWVVPDRSFIRMPLPAGFRGKDLRVRLKTEKAGSVDCKLTTDFLDQRFTPQKLPNSVSHDASSGTEGGAVTSLSWSHTTGASATGIAIYGACVSPTINSATYAGNSATSVANSSNTWAKARIFSYASPTSGSQTVAVNFSASTNASAGSTSVLGGDTSTVMDGAATAYDGGFGATSLSVNVTSATGDLVYAVLNRTGISTASPVTEGASQTRRTEFNTYSNGWSISSTEPGAGSVTMSWSWTGGDGCAIAAANFKAGAAATTMITRTLMGAGV